MSGNLAFDDHNHVKPFPNRLWKATPLALYAVGLHVLSEVKKGNLGIGCVSFMCVLFLAEAL